MANRISSEYDMIEKFTEIASNYFGEDISKQRIGMFGYVTESMAKTFNSVLMDSYFRSKEFHSITARRIQTLMMDASTLKIDASAAVPATMDTFISIETNDIFKKGIMTGDDYSFVIDKDTVVNILGYEFMLEYDINIISRKVGNNYTYSTQFVTDDSFAISELKNPYLLNTRSIQDGRELLMIRTPLRQMTKLYKYHVVMDNDEINLTGVEFPYEGQVAYFNIYYREPNKTKFELVDKHYVYDQSVPTTRYLLYDNDTEEKTIRIYSDSFIPKFNSEIRLDIYTTTGNSGNFEYQGDDNDISVSLKSYNDSRDYIGVELACVPIGPSVGGKDVKSLDELRHEVINRKATLGGFDTYYDLMKYFNEYDGLNNVIFIEKRSDVIERRFTSYMIPRQINGDIIPTSTLSLKLNVDDFDNYYPQTYRRVLKANNTFTLMDESTDIVVKNNLSEEHYDELENDTSKLLFGMPYLMVVNESPMFVSFYKNSINNRFYMVPKYINDDVTTHFVVNFMRVNRNPIIGDDSYSININVMPSGDINHIVDENGDIIEDSIIISGFVYVDDNIKYYFNFDILEYNADGNYFVAEAKVKTDDYLSPQNDVEIIDSLYEPKSLDFKNSALIPATDLEIGIAIYNKIDDYTGPHNYPNILPDNMSDYVITNIYVNTHELCSLYTDMTDVVKSTVVYDGEYLLSEIPLVRRSHLEQHSARISDVINMSKVRLDELSRLITNNFSIDYKFFKTYGQSSYFYIGHGENKQILDRLDLSLKFKAYVQPIIQILDNELLLILKTRIKQLIESLNIDSNDYTIFISNVITTMENEYSEYLLSLDLVNINEYGDNLRVIRYERPDFNMMSSDELRKYVPEYINVALENIEIELIR